MHVQPTQKRRYNATELAALFREGRNVMDWVRGQERSERNTPTTILYSYDIQAGSYTQAVREPDHHGLKARIARRLEPVFRRLAPSSLLDAGCGEATTLAPCLDALGAAAPAEVLGFDISLSRLLYATANLRPRNARLFTAEIGCIPLAAASVDVGFTFHALEPNRGREAEILAEMLRVARGALVLVEPSYELASETGRARMDRLGYVRDLAATLRELGCTEVREEPFGADANTDNPAALIVVEKPGWQPGAAGDWISPISGLPLLSRPDCLFCPHDGHAFPVIAGIPCLTRDAAILASKLATF